VRVEFYPASWVCQEAIQLTRELRLTAYDASYLALARRIGLPLATLDQELHGCGNSWHPGPFAVQAYLYHRNIIFQIPLSSITCELCRDHPDHANVIVESGELRLPRKIPLHRSQPIPPRRRQAPV
jgi:hypothetical protein